MKRPKLTPKGEQTRRRIAAAAAELMLERGVVGTTLEDVREVAGVSSSQIYHYFADKQALVRAVVEHQTAAVVGKQEEMLAELDSLAGLRWWRDALVEHQRVLDCRGGCPIGSLGSELAEIDPEARGDIAAGFRRWETRIRGCFEAMHASGELVPDADPDELAMALLAALQGGLLLTEIQRDTKPLEVALDAVLTLVGTLTTSSLTGPAERRETAGLGDVVAGHVLRFNTAVRGGGWEQFGTGFAPDAAVDFDGVAVPPMAGREAIVDGYRAMSPDDTLTVLATELDGERVIATFAWDAEPGVAAGAFVIEAAGGLITRLTVRLGAPAAR